MENIELVIKIPEDLKKMIFDDEVFDIAYSYRLAMCVKNGTLLPKGHGDLIDRKELLKQPINTANYPSNYVDIAPTIIEADSEVTK